MIRKWIAKNESAFIVIALTIISAVVYLPLIRQLGYMNDDWYLMYSVGAYGPGAFIDIFSVDRPGRALVMIPAYLLFGNNPLYYNLSAYVFRLISAVAFLWALRMLFPRQHRVTFLASLLFLIYPGFLSQPNGIDYQSHFIGLVAAHLSIALTIKAVLTDRFGSKIILHALSVLFGLLYLSQMEWYIGFEFFRWGSVLLLSLRMGGSLFQKAWRAIRLACPSLLIPGIFLVWRIFFFQAERTATDVNIQFAQVKLYPLPTIYHWTIQVMQDLFDVIIFAWVTPLSQLTGYIQRLGGVLAVIVVGILLYVLYFYADHNKQYKLSDGFSREGLLLGLFISIGGLIPIAMVNREVAFPAYSRYSLVSSAGVAILISTLLRMLKRRYIRNGMLALFVLVSVLTHHANTVKAVEENTSTNNFWWQVFWRVPQLEKNTTLIANYPNVPLEEDYFIWGPANLIYYPEKQSENNIQPGVYAAILSEDTVEKVLARERQEYDKRKTIITYANYRNILVITQPSLNSCVHVLDGAYSEFSNAERDLIREIGPYSEIEHVLADETPPTLPTIVFGSEPAHGWCYFYQKADLARQQGEWNQVLEIGEQAFGQGFEPEDPIEWMPFLQAYAMTGNIELLTKSAPIITSNSYISLQACQIINAMPDVPADIANTVDSLYCPK